MVNIVLELHTFTCYFMTGLIWIVQIVHYPSFEYIKEEDFLDFASFHQKNITQIVMPIMIVELLSAFYLIKLAPIFYLNLFLTLTIWLVTFFYSVPAHKKLCLSKEISIISRLVKTNWLRTILWSARTLLILIFLINSN